LADVIIGVAQLSTLGVIEIFVHSVADILYLVLAILFAILLFRAAFGLLPRARPRVWPVRTTGYKDVRLSRFSLVSSVCAYFGLVAAFASAAFSVEISGLIGLFIFIVGFVLVSISRWRDVRRFRQQRLAALTA
jgi:hypothetical protein